MVFTAAICYYATMVVAVTASVGQRTARLILRILHMLLLSHLPAAAAADDDGINM
jgi:hypothetical protein